MKMYLLSIQNHTQNII